MRLFPVCWATVSQRRADVRITSTGSLCKNPCVVRRSSTNAPCARAWAPPGRQSSGTERVSPLSSLDMLQTLDQGALYLANSPELLYVQPAQAQHHQVQWSRASTPGGTGNALGATASPLHEPRGWPPRQGRARRKSAERAAALRTAAAAGCTAQETLLSTRYGMG